MPRGLADVVATLDRLAPPELADEWDNVGLLVDTVSPEPIADALLAIDLREDVLDEAIQRGCGLIVAYHPPIFAPLRRLRVSSPKERIVLRAVDAGIAIHSPHTALDAAPGGVNDWLADGLGAGQRTVLVPSPSGSGGQGREVQLDRPARRSEIVARIKAHLALSSVRVAAASPDDAPVGRIALCAGAGGSVLESRPADLYWTGEMRHHDVLAALDRGTSVVLCDHTHTERGYLRILRDRLAAALGSDVRFHVSERDAEPLRVV